ncbi:MAG: histidine phosphatase family protein [Pseudomonadota bacterium]
MADIYWVRHGPTHAKAMVGWSDLPADLSDTSALARLSEYLPNTAKIVSSDLARARATADAITDGRNRLHHDPNLREMNFGDWEMWGFAQATDAEPERAYALWDQPGEVRPPGGESWNALTTRVNHAAERLIGLARKDPLVIVSHMGPILTQLQRALDVPAVEAFAHKIEPLSVTHIRLGPRWELKAVNVRP